MSFRYPQPDNEISFEKFSLAFLKAHWRNPRLELYAHRGQKQNGVDIFDPSHQRPFRGAQCKHHEPHAAVSPTEIADEVEKASKFEMPLEHYAFLTTAKGLKNADDLILEINKDHNARGLFSVELFDWARIADMLDDYPDVADLLTPARNSQLVAIHAELGRGHREITTELFEVRATVANSSYDSEIDAAQEYLDVRNPQVARALFEKIRQRRWDSLSPSQKLRVLSGLANVCVAQGRDREAGRLLISAKEAHPESDRAQINEALGYEMLGDSERAHAIATELRASYPSAGKLAACWIRTHAENDVECLKSQIPEPILDDPEVGVALAIKAMHERRYDLAKTFARSAITAKDGWVGPHLILGRACLQEQVTLAQTAPWTARKPCDASKLLEAVASLDRAIQIARDNHVDQVLAEALVYRAISHSLLANDADAERDFDEAVRVSPEEPGVLLHHAQHLRDRGDIDQAVKTLRKLVRLTGAVEAKHHLASVLVNRDEPGDRKEASAIFREVAQTLVGGPPPTLKIMVAEQVETMIQDAFYTAVDDLIAADQSPAVDEFLDKIPEGRVATVALKTTKSKQAWSAGNHKGACRLATEAVDSVDTSTSRVDLRALAAHLMNLDKHKDALALWERLCPLDEYSSDVRHLIRCAERVDRQDVILRTARTVRESGIDDPWLLHKELNVLQTSDVEKAIEVLRGYLERNPSDHASRMRLTLIGLETGRSELIDGRSEVMPDLVDVTPVGGAMAVDVLRKTGRSLEAVSYAYGLYRRFNDDPVACMALFTAVFAVDSETPQIPDFQRVEPGCAVLYAEDGRADSWIVVEDSEDANRLLGEYPPDDPLVIELLGKRVGDSFTLGPSMGRDRVATVREIVSKYVYRTRFIAEGWQMRFRDYPWINVFRTLRRNPETGEDEFDPADMKLLADRDFERKTNAEEDYRNRAITLHVFAHLTGSKDFEASLYAATTPGLGLNCWNGPPDEWTNALAALRDSPEVVLDLSALATLYILGDHAILADWRGKLIVSQNTINDVRVCLPSPPGRERAKGRFGKTERGYHFIEVDDAAVEEYRMRLSSFLQILDRKVEVCGCEDLVYLDPEKRRTFSGVFGQHGLESMLLGSRPGRVLWSDDAFLAAIARSEFGARFAWTQVAVEHGVAQGFLADERARDVGARLLGFDYKNTVFDERVLWKAAGLAEWDPTRWPLLQALRQFSNPSIPVGNVGRLAVAVIIKLFGEVAFPPSRQRVLIDLAERLFVRPNGLPLVKAIASVLPRRFGLNIVHCDEAARILNAWIAEASRRVEIVSTNLLIIPPTTRVNATRVVMEPRRRATTRI